MKDDNYNAFGIFLNSRDEAVVEYAKELDKDEFEDWELPKVSEGKLAVDVAHNETEIIVVSTMAGAVVDKIEVYVHNDLLTIRGLRESPLTQKKKIAFFYEECYWGVFSRTIVLPTEVKGEFARAEYKNGILTVTIPKRLGERRVHVEILED